MIKNWYIGCSGFSNKDWKGSFYPPKMPQGQWLSYYAEHLNALEVNTSFYRFPTRKLFEGWYAKTPPSFFFSVKVPRLITHYKQMVGTEEMLAGFYETCIEGLAEKLGSVLFQFGPQFEYSEGRLHRITSQLRIDCTNVVEFRHPSWWQQEVFSTLGASGIVFCGISYPDLPADIVVNGSAIYYRFHGIPKLYYSGYEEKELTRFADLVKKEREVKKVMCFFNNTATMAAMENARNLKSYVKGK